MEKRFIEDSAELQLLDKCVKNYFGGEKLYDYQKDLYWRLEKNELNIINKSRQIGISFFYAGYTTLKAIRGETSLIASPSLRQSTRVMNYITDWLRAFQDLFNFPDDFVIEHNKSICRFSNRGSVEALPNSASSIRGSPANRIFLDEYAHFLHGTDKLIWEALIPSISRGQRKSICVNSTPFGEVGLYADMYNNRETYPDFKDVFYSYEECPDINIDIIKRNMDILSFQQEYEGKFHPDIGTYYPYSITKPCINMELEYAIDLLKIDAPLYIGADIGRRRDFTAICVLADINNKPRVVYRKVLRTLEEKEWANQYKVFREILSHPKVVSAYLDNGFGQEMVETLQNEFDTVLPFNFTNENKAIMHPLMRKRMEEKNIDYPEDMELINCLHIINRIQAGNNIKFDSEKRTDEHGHCYDDQTEVLTKEGWKKFENVTYLDEIATLKDEEYLEYQLPIDIYKSKYSGEMYKIKGKFIDLKVTPNHKLYIDGIGKIEAQELFKKKKKWRGKSNLKWEGKEEEFFELPEHTWKTNARVPYKEEGYSRQWNRKRIKIQMDNWLRFFGYFLSEGFTSTDNRIGVTQQEGEVMDKMEEVCNKLPFPFHKEIGKNSNSLRTKNSQLWKYLSQFGKSYEKFIPTEYKHLSKRQLNILLDALMEGDGCIRKKVFAYFSTSERLANDVQEIAIKCGYTSHISKRIKFHKDSKNIRPLFTVHIQRKHGHYPTITNTGKHSNVSKEQYVGDIHCVTVPNGIVYVRRNGKATWSGNSDLAVSLVLANYCYEREKYAEHKVIGKSIYKHSDAREKIIRGLEKSRGKRIPMRKNLGMRRSF